MNNFDVDDVVHLNSNINEFFIMTIQTNTFTIRIAINTITIKISLNDF